MKNILLPAFVIACTSIHAQYYYNDIVATGETNSQMLGFTSNKVLKVTATGIDPQGIRTADFTEMQEVIDHGHTLKITTRNINGLDIYYNRFDDQGRLVLISDSSGNQQSSTEYSYDDKGRIAMIRNTTKDTSNDFNQEEIHRWSYDANGKPQRMWRTINNGDSLEIRFNPDEKGNTGDERSFKRGAESSVIYYYYDDKNRLTDIVRFNNRVKRLMPDFMFEYDDKDRVIQKITTTSSFDIGYLIWRYAFGENGLKTKEALFNKKKEMTGKIEYNYTFGQ